MEKQVNLSREEENEGIYVNIESSRNRKNTTNPKRKALGHYKCAVACLGLLCVLLGAINIGLWIKTVADANQMQTMYTNLTQATEDLQNRYSNDTVKLQRALTTMAAEMDALHSRFCDLRMQITQYAVDVTLDPDTAENNLVLSADRREVSYVHTPQNLSDNPKRFNPVICVLGKQGFSSGRFYYVVQVSGKNEWYLGLAKDSVNRKGDVILSLENGYWVIWLKDNKYWAIADQSVSFTIQDKPERVGVFVDYDGGLVSFYDADRWNLLYSYKDVSFSETMYPFFSPGTNTEGQNSAPLIIIPVLC